VTPIDGDFDQPSTVEEHTGWLAAAGLEPTVVWSRQDLAVVAADKPA
jgi:hypothetical protein